MTVVSELIFETKDDLAYWFSVMTEHLNYFFVFLNKSIESASGGGSGLFIF
jgi:hypothetical protein